MHIQKQYLKFFAPATKHINKFSVCENTEQNNVAYFNSVR